MQIRAQGSVSAHPDHCSIHVHHCLSQPRWLPKDFLELSPGATRLNRLALSSNCSFHPLGLSGPFPTFKVHKTGSQSSWALQHFLKCHLNDNTVGQPHYHPGEYCRWGLKLVCLAERASVQAFITFPLCAIHYLCMHFTSRLQVLAF